MDSLSFSEDGMRKRRLPPPRPSGLKRFWQSGLTGSAFQFDQWSPHRRIAVVLATGQTCLLVGMTLRLRMGYFVQSMHPNYMSSQWAPFAKSLVELSLFVMALGVGLTIIALHRWLQGATERSNAHDA